MKTFTAAALFALGASAAWAGQTFDSTGTIKGTSSAEITAIAENHMVMLAPSKHAQFDMVADGHPFADMSGECNGGVEFLNGAALGQGVCVYENSNGEALAIRWSGENITPDGTFHGNWLIIGGTGKLTGLTGGGGFSSITNRDTGVQDITLTGAMTTK